MKDIGVKKGDYVIRTTPMVSQFLIRKFPLTTGRRYRVLKVTQVLTSSNPIHTVYIECDNGSIHNYSLLNFKKIPPLETNTNTIVI